MQIAISRLHFPVTTLGPGRRIGIWVQGCKIRCSGCVSLDTWAEGKGITTTDDVVRAITPWLGQADGVTISGGEPFDQAEALAVLLQQLPLAAHQDVFAYSGYAYEEIQFKPALRQGRIDALISDPYQEAAPQTLPLRGSDNQRLHLLTDLGRRRFSQFDSPANTARPSLDVMFDDDGTVWLAGIPRPGDMQRLRSLLGVQGHEIRTTASPK
jgi:anaerobic ribonucleoside-triphosphate reductase activating protein